MRGAFARAKAFRPRPTRFGRQRILQTTAELLRDRKETFARLITAESGLCWKDSLYVANRAYDVWSFAARLDIKDDGEICSCASVRTARCAKSTRRARRTAVKRIRVVDSVANRLANKVPPRAAALKCGDPMDPATDVGTVINQRSARLFEARVTDTLAHGAERIYGGERRGALSPPAHRRRPGSVRARTGAREATFGLVTPIIRCPDDIGELSRISNSAAFGLSSSVCANSLDCVGPFVAELEVGPSTSGRSPAIASRGRRSATSRIPPSAVRKA